MNQITITSPVSEGLAIISRPINADVGLKPLSSFHLSVTAMTPNYTDADVILYAHNSRSVPYHPDTTNIWQPLKPQWKFVYNDDAETPISERATVTYDTEILSGGEVVGAIGSLEFLYIDDMPSEIGSPVMIFATLDADSYYDKDLLVESIFLSGYYNSEMTVILPFYVNPLPPSFIRFTQNGREELLPFQWTGSSINAFATIHGMPSPSRYVYEDINDMRNYPILFSYPTIDTPLYYELNPLSGDSAPYTSQFVKSDVSGGLANGGWARVNVLAYENSPKAILQGRTTLSYDPNVITAASEQSGTLWVSNTSSNTLHKITSMFIDPINPALSGIFNADADKVYPNIQNEFVSVPYYDAEDYPSGHSVTVNSMELSGYSGIYAIAVLPNSTVWTADYELDRIYKRNDAGEIIQTIDLQLLTGIPEPYAGEYTWYGPNSISINSLGSVYCSLYNSVSCVRIDPNDYTTSFFSPTGDVLSASDIPLSAVEFEQNLLRPVKLMCDKNNGVHVAYGNISRAAFAHFDINESVQNAQWVTTTEQYVPTDFVILKNTEEEDNLIVAMYGTDVSDVDGLYKISYNYSTNQYSEPQLLVTCSHPYFLTFDTNENIWFAYDNNKIGKLSELSAIPVSGVELSAVSALELPTSDALSDSEIIGGICFDKTNNINVLESYSNMMYRWNYTEEISGLSDRMVGLKIYPHTTENLINDGGVIQTVSGDVPSLMAYGDWSGRIYEYTYTQTGSALDDIELTISGSSVPFSIESVSSKYGVRRYNDSWDMAEQIKSYIYPDYQKQFVSLWDDFVGTIVGNASSDYLTIGRQYYEKIANFVINHSDIDTANVDQMHSLLESIGITYSNYNIPYPAELKHWMNVLSVAFEKLKGEQFRCNRNFTVKSKESIVACPTCGQIHPTNLGDIIERIPSKITVYNVSFPYTDFNGDYLISEILPSGHPLYIKDGVLKLYYNILNDTWYLSSDISSIFTATVSGDGTIYPPKINWSTSSISTSPPTLEYAYPFMHVGTPVVVEDAYMSNNQFDIFYPPISGDFSQLEAYGFRAPFTDQYNVYEFIDSPSGVYNSQCEGLINWGDEYNQFAIQTQNTGDWFKQNGDVEKLFIYSMFKNVSNETTSYSTDVSVQSSAGWNDINVFTESDIIQPDFNIIFDRNAPLVEEQTSPICKYVVPIYKQQTPAELLDFSSYVGNLLYDSESILSTDKFLFVVIGENYYYVPLYMDRFGSYQLTPIYGTGGLHVNYSIVENPNRMTAFGFLGFNYMNEYRFIPIYTCPVAPAVLVPPTKLFKMSWEEWINQ